jgi:hypothetical protein
MVVVNLCGVVIKAAASTVVFWVLSNNVVTPAAKPPRPSLVLMPRAAENLHRIRDKQLTACPSINSKEMITSYKPCQISSYFLPKHASIRNSQISPMILYGPARMLNVKQLQLGF